MKRIIPAFGGRTEQTAALCFAGMLYPRVGAGCYAPDKAA